MTTSRIFTHLNGLLSVLFFLAGCAEIPATNPFDPESPVELQRKASLHGVVLDVETRAPIIGAVVTLSGPTDPENNPLTTQDDGNVADGAELAGAYRFENLAPGRYRLEVVHAGHVAQVIELGRVEAGADITQDILMVPNPQINPGGPLPAGVGRISGIAHKQGQLAIDDEALRDHSGITVEVVGSGVRTVTNRVGAFDLFLNAGTYTLELSAPNYITYRVDQAPVAPIELEQGAEVVLETPITLQSDPGVVSGVVLLEGAQDGGHGDTVITLANTSLTTVTNDDGSFRIDDVPAGVYTLRASKDRFDTQSVSGVVVASHPDTVVDTINLPLSRGTLEGLVRLAAADSSGGVEVRLLDSPFSSISGESGDFRIAGIPVGEYSLQACRMGYEPGEGQITITADGVTRFPADGQALELARQQIQISGDDAPLRADTLDYTLAFAQVPQWATSVKLTGDLAAGESQEFRPYDAERGAVDLVLTPNDGTKHLTVQFRGDACHVSNEIPVEIHVDAQAPVLVDAQLNFGDRYLNSPTAVPLEVICTDGATNPTFITMLAVDAEQRPLYNGPWSPLVTVDLPNVEGDGRISIRCVDPAGNVSEISNLPYNLDSRAPPVGPRASRLRINEGSPYTNTLSVRLEILAEDNPGGSGLADMAVGSGLDCDDAPYQPYRSILGWELGVGEIQRTIDVCLRDRAGNTALMSSSIIVDTVAPTGEIRLIDGVAVASDRTQVLVRVAPDDPVLMKVGVGPVDCESSDGYALRAEERPVVIENLQEGLNTITVCLRDRAGNTTRYTDEVRVDTGAPEILSTTLNAGQTFLNTAMNIGMAVQCSDGATASADLMLRVMATPADANRAAIAYEGPWLPRIRLLIPPVEGRGLLEVFCIDEAGNQSLPTRIDYVLDSEAPPSGANGSQLVINNGDSFTNERSVRLAITAVDNRGGSGLDAMAIGSDALDCADANYEPLRDVVAWELPAGEIEHFIKVCIRDRAGNATALRSSITLDTVPPSGELLLLAGALTNQTRTPVRANRNGVGPLGMKVGTGFVDCDGGGYQAFTGEQIFVDGLVEGYNPISLCLRDAAGNTAKYVEAITVDLTAPNGFIVPNNQGTTYFTSTREVELQIVADDDVARLYAKAVPIAEGEQGGPAPAALNCDTPQNRGAAVDFSPRYIFTLPEVEGGYHILLCLYDAAGNASESFEYKSYVLDITPPFNAQIVVNSGLEITSETDLSVAVSASDSITSVEMLKLSQNDSCTGGAWEPYVPGELGEMRRSFEVSGGDNRERAISVVFRNSAGLESDCVSDSLIVDTVGPSISSVAARSLSGNAERTGNRDIEVLLTYTSAGSPCDGLELSEDPEFATATRTDRCSEDPIAFELSRRTGRKTIYARGVDELGNVGALASTSIELDIDDPGLGNVRIFRGPGSIQTGRKYSNRQDLTVALEGGDADNLIRYDFVVGGGDCPEAGALNTVMPYSDLFTVRAQDESLVTLCVALEDDAGNVSEVLSDSITIDLTPPPAPTIPRANLTGINATCAYIEAERSDVADFWQFEFRSAGSNWSEMGDRQDPNDLFDPSDEADTAHIKFALEQDNDNLLQVRVRDKAGNVSEASTALVEEVSSYLIPSDLRMKQVCNGGQYAILKEELETDGAYTRPTCVPSQLFIGDTPEVALLDLERLTTRQLTPSLTLADVSAGNCAIANLNNSILDAACSPEPGQPALLIAKPGALRGGEMPTCVGGGAGECADILADAPLVHPQGDLEFVVIEDPIDAPGSPYVSLGFYRDARDHKLAIRSLDVLRWNNPGVNYFFKALGTDSSRVYSTIVDRPIEGPAITRALREDRTYLRRIEYAGGNVIGQDPFDHVSGLGRFDIFGLSFQVGIRAQHYHYLRYDTNDEVWRVYRTGAVGTAGVPMTNFTESETDRDVSPFRTKAHPAHWTHNGGVTQQTSILLMDGFDEDPEGYQVRAIRSHHVAASFGNDMNAQNLEQPAAFFEAEDSGAWLVDPEDTRTIYLGGSFNSSRMRLRYAIDTSLPIFPAPSGNGEPGEPFIMYHTTGVTRGIVIAYRDDNDPRSDECAR